MASEKTNETGFLSSFLSKGLRTNQLEVNTDEKTLRPVARLKEPRDLFALPRDKENDCPQQAPRWPIECQVIEDRIVHIASVPPQPEPYYQPTGNELKPHPVGEDAGVVVFSYNPISAVNYEVQQVKIPQESSDSDISSSESRASTPKPSNMALKIEENPFAKMLDVKNPFSKLLQSLHLRSSSHSNEDDDDDDESGDDEFESATSQENSQEKDRLAGGEDEIQDIWGDKTPEYQAATPTFIKSQFGKNVPKIYTEATSFVAPFSRSAAGGSKIVTNCHPSNYDEAGEYLEFESRFESGNLAKAVKITESYYELYLRPDLYTSRSKQWFYFRVRRTKKDMTYRFSIVNLVKSDSLYNEGMRPVMYSTTAADKSNEGWKRFGENIRYYRNDDDTINEEEDENTSYTLTFNVVFPYDNDTVYLAHNYPYTYSELQEYLMDIQKHPVKSKFCKLRLLCRSLAGNNVYYLTVTAPTQDEEAMRRKKSVIVSARVHPSETPASWMMKGLMDFITGDTTVAKRLRHRFIFKLIPMLNPDGVIVGNTRNSLTGKDLNRQYRTVIRETYPSIWYTKAMIKRLIDECGIAMYCDMHAHSRKHNIFIYGCENRRSPEKKLTEQVFPLMMHKNVADKFSFESCKFKVQRSKEGTGRIVMWMLGITNSYTIEASFGGSSLGSRKGTHFNTADYEHIGRAFCETLLDFYDDNPNKERLRLKIIERLLKEGSSADEPLNIPLSDYSSDEGASSSSSDNEGKDSCTLSDLEGPCCAPLRAPPTSPEGALIQRKFKITRMRKVMSHLDRIYFQPMFKKKFSNMIRGKKKKNPKKIPKKDELAFVNKIPSESEDDSASEVDTPRKGLNVSVNSKKTKLMNEDESSAVTESSRQKGGNEDNITQATTSNSKNVTNSKVRSKCLGNATSSNLPLGTRRIVTKPNKKNKKNKKERKTNSHLEIIDEEPPEGKETRTTKIKRVKVSRILRLWLEKQKIMIVRRERKPRVKRNNLIRKKRDQADRTPLDMPTTDPGSDILFSTDDEMVLESNQEPYNTSVPRARRNLLQSELQRRYLEEIGEFTMHLQKQMPPELIVTSPTKTLTDIMQQKSTVVKELPQTAPTYINLKTNELYSRACSWQNLISNKYTTQKIRLQSPLLNDSRETSDDLQLKLSLKKKIWTGVQPDLHTDRCLQRSLSPLGTKREITRRDTKKEVTRTEKKDENELLLTACSQKLLAWQQSGNNITQAEAKTKLTVNLLVRDVNESQNHGISNKSSQAKINQKLSTKTNESVSNSSSKIKLKKNSMSKIAETTHIITRLAKAKSRPLILTAKKLSKNAAPSNSLTSLNPGPKSFKTGGIVVTAIQSKHIHRKKKTSNSITNFNNLERNVQPANANNVNVPVSIKTEDNNGLVRKAKSKIKKKKRSSSANTGGK